MEARAPARGDGRRRLGVRAGGGRLNDQLRRAEELRAAALRVLEDERARLRRLGIAGVLVLTGGSSVPGALTRGDVDLHLRVPPEQFPGVVTALRAAYPVVHPAIWAPTLATFVVPADVPAGLAATPIGSEHDVRFTVAWRRLAEDPALVAEYNACKLAGNAGYEDRKSAFFDRVVADAQG